MTDLERSLIDAVAALRSIGARYALVGGLAVSTRAEPRLTRDADLAVSVASDAEAERLVLELQAAGYRVIAVVEQEATGRLAAARLTTSAVDRAIVTDLLFASCGIEPEIVERADLVEVLPGVTLPVASVAHLLAMKLLAGDFKPGEKVTFHSRVVLTPLAMNVSCTCVTAL